jgi:guanine nucleotide-binding protein G(o) subunit alpha
LHVTENNRKFKAIVNDWKEDSDVTPDMIAPIESLWLDPGIQATFKANAGRLLLLESLGYWMNKLDRITSESYVPDLQDVLRSRAPTTGIVETEFEIEGSHFLMIDVGGQRNERKKWIHCFQEVTSLIFVSSLNSYDQVLYEDETANGMFEALNLFEDTINMDYFKNVDVILFLNKSDLFREKIKKTPLTVFFTDYKGSQEFDECVSFIEEEFRLRVKDVDKDLYCHVTCATDTSNVQFTFNAVKNIIIRKGLSDAGIMG